VQIDWAHPYYPGMTNTSQNRSLKRIMTKRTALQMRAKEMNRQHNEVHVRFSGQDQQVEPWAAPLFVVEPSRGWISLQLWELWEYRELLYFLAWRDIKVRYKQTSLGVIWAIVQPFVTMVLFSLFFGYLAGIPSDGVPYPIFTFVALLPWQLFANSLSASSNSLVLNQELIKKVYFPRLIIPISAVCVGLIDFGISFIVLLGMMYYFHFWPTLAFIFLPIFIILAIIAALTVGLWLSTLNVQYRDVQFTIPALTQFWLLATPIAYSSSLIPEQWRLLYGFNPMVGVIEGFRWALLGQTPPSGNSIIVSVFITGTMLIGGLIYFKRTEKTFADVV
jgi:lipopolysaccharide transport system permease protein